MPAEILTVVAMRLIHIIIRDPVAELADQQLGQVLGLLVTPDGLLDPESLLV
jgi:hypothetical protein